MGDVRTTFYRAVLLGSILVTAIGLVGYGATAMAQEQEQPVEKQVKEEVTVTGTLIPRPTLEAMSPVATLEVEELAYRGTTRLEDLLTQLPQIFVAQNSTISNGASGTATVNLRYLGTVRTLVLIDGRRMSNGDAFAVAPDLNFIPASLVKRVDVLTGGASATYGADAVTGVVNFILDKDFEGMRGGIQFGGYQHDNRNTMVQEMNTAAGFTAPTGQAWDGGALNADVAFGGKFAEGKGHASAYLNYRQVSALAKNRRDYTNCSSALGTTGPICGGSGTTPEGRFLVFTRANKRVGDYTLDMTTGNTFRNRVSTDVYNFAPVNFMQRPDQRYAGGGFASYRWNEHFEGYADVMLMADRSVGQIAESADFNNTSKINCNNPMLSDDQYQKICVAAGWGPTEDANLTVGRRNKEGGGRTYDFHHNSYRLVGGLKGEFSKAWAYDVYGLQAETSNPQVNGNQLSKTRLQNALFVIGDRNDPSTWQCRDAAARADGCVPWNIFTKGGVTQEAVTYISMPLVLNSGTRTQVLSGKVTADLKEYGLAFSSAAEGIQLALGTEYRKEKLYINPDEASLKFTAAGAGGPTLPVDGSYSVKELFAEALVPIVQGVRGAQDLSLELGYRWSDYNLAGKYPTYKAQATYAPATLFKVRAGYNRATRAPNVVELYTPAGVSLNGTADPCAGPTPVYTAEQCARTGVPIADYGTILVSPAGQYNTYSGGNPNLKPEIADTVTAGLVITPGSFTAALDYYDIKVQDVIGTLVAEDILNACATTGDPLMCNLIHRDVAGTLWLYDDGYTITSNQNVRQIRAKGVDANLSYTLPAGNSFFSFNLMGTYLINQITDTGIYSYDCVGYYGLQCAAVPTPEWRHLFRASWETGPWVLTLGWRYIGSVLNDDASPNPFLAAPNQIANEKVNGTYEIPAYNYFDLAASFKLKAGVQFLLGVNNIADKEPPLAAGNTYNDYGIGFYGMYDPYGRYIHTAIQFTF